MPRSSSPAERFLAQFGTEPTLSAHAPGRVNLLGAHVDYHQGLVLPGAIDRGLDFAAAARPDRCLRIVALDLERTAEIDLDALPPPHDQRPPSQSVWHDLPAGVAWACHEGGLATPGMDVVFGGDLPIGAGVSSSAAVEVGLLLLWNHLGDWGLDRTALAQIGQRAENGYLGVGSGIMDQFACLHGSAGHLLMIDCRTLTYERLALPDGCAVLVIDSGVRRQLAASGYDERREECAEALKRLRESGFELTSLRDLAVEDLPRASAVLQPSLALRVRHVSEECARVRQAARALADGNATELGRLMSASHASSRDLYEVSIAELDDLAQSAASQPGCLGARLSGGGFGGCVTALVATDRVDEVASEVADRFEQGFGRRPPSFVCHLADGAAIELRIDGR